jgi:hypothetical protein
MPEWYLKLGHDSQLHILSISLFAIIQPLDALQSELLTSFKTTYRMRRCDHENQSTQAAMGRGLTLGPPKYEAGVMPTRQRRLVYPPKMFTSVYLNLYRSTPIK